jgi:hypothetical protein
MALNTTGKPNTLDYFLGRGILYLSEQDSDQLPSGGYRDLGNCPAFSMTVASEELLHQSSRSGLKVTDKRVTLSQDIQIAFSLDELSHDNYALFFTGLTSTVTNPAVAGVGTMMAPVEITDTAVLGRWYPLLTSYAGAGTSTAFSATSVPKIRRTSGMAMDLVLNTDYEINHKAGMVFLLADAVNVAAGDDVAWYSAADATAPSDLELMQALKGSVKNYCLKFIAANPVNDDEMMEFEFHSVQVSADGDLNLISDEFSQASFTGAAQRNSNPNIDGTLTIRSNARS